MAWFISLYFQRRYQGRPSDLGQRLESGLKHYHSRVDVIDRHFQTRLEMQHEILPHYAGKAIKLRLRVVKIRPCAT